MGLTEGQTDNLLTNQVIEPGEFNWVRLKVIENPLLTYITIGGENLELEIPSNAKTGLKVNRNFTVATGGVTRFTIDFDLRKSVHLPSCDDCNYKLRPTLRFIDNLEVGTLSGSVDSALLSDVASNCTDSTSGAVKAVVYVFTGSGVEPDDIDIDPMGADLGGVDPLTTAIVDANGNYMVPFVEAGDYTLSLTCQAELDNAAVDDVIEFTGSHDATVVVDQTTVVPAFTLPPLP